MQSENFQIFSGKVRAYLVPGNLILSCISLVQKLFEEAKLLSPNDARLKIMLGKIVKAYSILAEEKMADKEFSSAGELILQGLELDRDNEKLNSLQETITIAVRKINGVALVVFKRESDL